MGCGKLTERERDFHSWRNMIAKLKELAVRVLHTDDTPHKIAWGLAIGVLVAWTPTIGIQMAVAGTLAWILRGNVTAAVAIVWISNPYTAAPIYYFNYLVGYWLVGGAWLDWNWFRDLLTPAGRGYWEYLVYAYRQLASVFGPMFLGSLVAGLPLAIGSYVLTYKGVRRFRAPRAATQHSAAPLFPSRGGASGNARP